MKKNKRRKKIRQKKLSKSRRYRRYSTHITIASPSASYPKSGFKDNYGIMHEYEELIFPIVYHDTKRDKYFVRGTGYFFHPNGGFITAKHVLFEGGQQLSPCYAIQTLDTGRRFKRRIVVFFDHPQADIGVGMLEGQLVQNRIPQLAASLAISLSRPNIGDKISTFAFPKSEVIIEGDSQVGVFKGTWSKGEIKALIRAGEHFLLKTDSYETNMHIASGASGGPVLRGVNIIGVNSTGWELEEGQEPLSNITPVYEILDLEIQNSNGKKTTVKRLMEEGHVPFQY